MITRDHLNRRKAELQRHYEVLQQCHHFYPDEVERKRYAEYLRLEADLMAEEELLNAHECLAHLHEAFYDAFQMLDIVDRQEYLLLHAEEMPRPVFSAFWQATLQQREALHDQDASE